MTGAFVGVLFDGFAYGMLLFILSVGLSVTLGMMNFINLAHCSFAMLGGSVTVTVMDRLGEITVPTLLVGGRYDECTPGHMEEMHRRIPGSRLATIEDASHLCFAEQPEKFCELVNTFLDRG